VAVRSPLSLDWDERDGLAWLRLQLEPLLAASSCLGAQSRLLEKEEQIAECNMALERRVCHDAGGFLSMERFGSQQTAPSGSLRLLQQLHRRRGKMGLVSEALAYHRVGGGTRQCTLWRPCSQGRSEAIMMAPECIPSPFERIKSLENRPRPAKTTLCADRKQAAARVRRQRQVPEAVGCVCGLCRRGLSGSAVTHGANSSPKARRRPGPDIPPCLGCLSRR
jgi:hypothetical protein